MNGDNVIYFDSFGSKQIPKEIKKFIGNKKTITNIYRIQVQNSIMLAYLSIGFNKFMLKGESLFDYTNLFSPNKYKANEKIIIKYFQQLKTKNLFYEEIVEGYDEKISSIKCNKYRKFKSQKNIMYFDETLVLYFVCGKYGSKDEEIFKDENSTEILKIL